MAVEMLTGNVWTTLSEHLGRATIRRLAVGALGRGSAKLLHATVGDLVLVDGSAAALENGTTSASAIGRLVRTGATVISVPGLDTSAFLFDIDERLHAAVGAPAATRDAAERGSGAALLTDGPTAVRALTEQLAVWEASGTVIDGPWVGKARDRGRRPRRRPATYEPVAALVPQPDAETWVADARAGRVGPWRPLLAEDRDVRTWTPPADAGTDRPPVGALLILGHRGEEPELTTVLESQPEHLVLGATAGTVGPGRSAGELVTTLLDGADPALFQVPADQRDTLLAEWGIEDFRRARRDPLEFYPSMSDGRPGTPS